ncbi:MAG TPA: hypothetical protein PKC86_02035 [Candidatus Saccharibacteria bacterium]|nr:hypothetical protein [Candidatus Saccharibacteria bacterium]
MQLLGLSISIFTFYYFSMVLIRMIKSLREPKDLISSGTQPQLSRSEQA